VEAKMTDILIYWRDYRKNSPDQFNGEHPQNWHSNAKLLGELQPGDRLWVVTSGKIVRQEAEQAAFLVAIWIVQEAVENPGDDPAYPRDDYRYRIMADPEESNSFGDPVPVDHLLRPQGRDRAVPIGRFLQGPRRLDENKVRLLRAAAGPELALKWLTGNKT
jgi:hypothetical protein